MGFGVLVAAFLQARPLSGAIAQVVQSGAPDGRSPLHFNFLDPWRVDREGAFNADTMGSSAAHGYICVIPAASNADDRASKLLNPFPVAFGDAKVNRDGITRVQIGHVLVRFCLDGIHHVAHRLIPSLKWVSTHDPPPDRSGR